MRKDVLLKLLAAVMITACAAFGQKDITDEFTDTTFKIMVYQHIGKNAPEAILETDVDTIINFSVLYVKMSSLAGIEYFTSLEDLYCPYNQLTSLDVSKNTALKRLECPNNKLTSLNVSGCVSLEYINCNNNELTSLDVSGCPVLWIVNCDNNPLPPIFVTFKLNDSSPAKTVQVDFFGLIDYADSLKPISTGYRFMGWYEDPNSGNEWDFSQDRILTTDGYTLYAKWVAGYSGATITYPQTDFVYDGTPKKLGLIRVTLGGSTYILTEGVDFIVNYVGSTTNAGTVTATVSGLGEYEELIETAAGRTTTFTISKQSIPVVWNENREFVYNKMYQCPKWNIDFNKVPSSSLAIDNVQSDCGEYEAAHGDAPRIIINHSPYKENYELVNESVDYFRIVKKPLDVVLKDARGNTISVVMIPRRNIKVAGDLYGELHRLVGYDGFAYDTTMKIYDNKLVISGSLAFSVGKEGDFSAASRAVLTSGDILNNGDYVINVNVEGVSAKNYSFSETKLYATVFDDKIILEDADNHNVAMKDISRSDRKYGIIIEKNPTTTDFAEIKIRAPEKAEVKLTIYDNVGNVVYDATTRNDKFSWNLTNGAGRAVANGTYQVVAQVKSANGKTYAYSAKLGVRR